MEKIKIKKPAKLFLIGVLLLLSSYFLIISVSPLLAAGTCEIVDSSACGAVGGVKKPDASCGSVSTDKTVCCCNEALSKTQFDEQLQKFLKYTETKSSLSNLVFDTQVTIPGSIFRTPNIVGGVNFNGASLSKYPNLIGEYIKAIYNYGMVATSILAAIMLMIGGLIWLTAQGNSAKISDAKSFIGSSLVGLILALTAYLLLKAINPDLTVLTLPEIKTISEETAKPLTVEKCSWEISTCADKEAKMDSGYCINMTKPTTDQDKAICCCMQTAYGEESMVSGSDVVNLDESGVYNCCTISGKLLELGTNSISWGNIQSKDETKAAAACKSMLTTITKTIGEKTYHYEDTSDTTWALDNGKKCTELYAEGDKLKDQCKDKQLGEACQMTETSKVGSGYCIGGYCKVCIEAGLPCTYTNSATGGDFECMGDSGLCGRNLAGGVYTLLDITSDCNTFHSPSGYPDMNLCWGKPAEVNGKKNLGEDCSSNAECVPEACCLNTWSYYATHRGGWCYLRNSDMATYGISCMAN